MLGTRIGVRVGTRCGSAVGVQADPIGGPGFDLNIAILGQSNARGSGSIASADTGLLLDQAFSPVRMSCKLGVANTDPIVYDISLTDVALQPYQGSGVNMGFELSLGRYIVGTRGADAPYVTKMAVNGQDIETMLPGAGVPTNPKEMWLQLIEYLDASVGRAGRPLDAVIWSQWEADATSDAKANAYSGNLDTFFAALRARYGNFRIWMIKANPNATGGGILASSRNIIRTTQATWCGIGGNNAVLIDTDDLPLQTDNIHYHEDSYVIGGIRIAESIAAWNRPGRNTNVGTGPAPWVQDRAMPCVTSSGAGTLTPWMPKHLSGDRIYIAVVSSVTNVAPALTTANGFAQIASVAQSTNSVLTVYENVADSASEVSPVITPDATAEQSIAVLFTVRGASGTDGTSTSNGSANPGTETGPTTTQANDLLVFIAGCHSGTQSQNITAWTDSNLTGFGEARDTRRIVNSNAEMVGLGTGTKASAGASGPATITYASGTPSQTCVAIAFKP